MKISIKMKIGNILHKLWIFLLLTILVYAIYRNIQIGSIINTVGFWIGFYDGAILPIRFIGSIFNADIVHFMNPLPDSPTLYIWGYLAGVSGAGVISHINRLIDLIFKIIK